MKVDYKIGYDPPTNTSEGPLTGSESAALAEEAIASVPPKASGIKLTVRVTQGDRLPKPYDDYPSGIGVKTEYGVVWIIDWRELSEPIALFDTHAEARQLLTAINDHKEKRWGKTQTREPLDGDGSSQPESSSEKRTGGSHRRTRPAKPSRSRRTR